MNDFGFACCVALGKSLPFSGLLLYPNGVRSGALTEQSEVPDLLGLAAAAETEQDRGSCSLGPVLYLGHD